MRSKEFCQTLGSASHTEYGRVVCDINNQFSQIFSMKWELLLLSETHLWSQWKRITFIVNYWRFEVLCQPWARSLLLVQRHSISLNSSCVFEQFLFQKWAYSHLYFESVESNMALLGLNLLSRTVLTRESCLIQEIPTDVSVSAVFTEGIIIISCKINVWVVQYIWDSLNLIKWIESIQLMTQNSKDPG